MNKLLFKISKLLPTWQRDIIVSVKRHKMVKYLLIFIFLGIILQGVFWSFFQYPQSKAIEERHQLLKEISKLSSIRSRLIKTNNEHNKMYNIDSLVSKRNYLELQIQIQRFQLEIGKDSLERIGGRIDEIMNKKK